MARHRLPRWKQIIVLAMTIWGILTIAPDLLRPVWHYGTLGFEANNDGRIETVDETIQAQPIGCINKHDWIEMKPSLVPSRDLLAVFGGMGGMQYVRADQVVHLSVSRTPNGPTHPCKISAVKLSGKQADLWPPRKETVLFWGPILLEDLLGIFFIYLCARIVWQHPSPAAWGFFLYGLWFNPGQYFAFYAELQLYPAGLVLQEVAQSLFQAAGYVGFIVFALTFPDRPVSPGWQPLYRLLSVLGVMLALLQLASFASAFGIRTEAVTDWSYMAGVAVDVGVWLILMQRYRDMDPIAKQRTRWVLWGCAVGLTAFIFADINEATSLLSSYWQPDENLLAWFYMANFLVALAIYVAIRRYRVLDVHFQASRWVNYLLAILFLTGGLLLAEEVFKDNYLRAKVLAVTKRMGWDEKHSEHYILLPLGMLLTFGAEKLRERLDEVCNKLFFRRLHDAKKHLKDIEAKFDAASEFDAVDELLIQEPVCWLGIASAAVFRKQSGSLYRRLVPAVGWPEGTGIELPADTPVVEKLKLTRQYLRLDDVLQLPIPLPEDVGQPVLAFPICNADNIAAVVIYGAHREGDNILREEINILRELVEKANSGYARSEVHLLRQMLAQIQQGQMPPGTSVS